MNKNKITLVALFVSVVLLTAATPAYSQAFRKGAFIINISEGSTSANYSTYGSGENSGNIAMGHEGGNRDPLVLEYGITNRWGIGLSSGTDFYYINPQYYYGFGNPSTNVKATTEEFTIDGSYHFMVTPKTDFSVVASIGSSSVSMKGSDADTPYQYTAKGGIARLGIHARFYIGYHFGFLVMASIFSMTNSTKYITGNTVGNNYTTALCGRALEFGFCYRIKK